MFTGIVEELGSVVALERGTDSGRIAIRGPVVTRDATPGASIAVNGTCLTVTDLQDDRFTVDVMAETFARTTVGDLAVGDRVNLERALAARGRFGGHIVQGHIDGTATVVERIPGERWEVVRFALPDALAPYVVEKGSIALDGTSLTVSAIHEGGFSVSLIPTTLELTTLGTRQVGQRVNVEVDVLAKYVERLIAAPAAPGATATTERP